MNKKINKLNKMYIRFKNIPDNEISGVYDGDLGKIRNELGVCCYIKNVSIRYQIG